LGTSIGVLGILSSRQEYHLGGGRGMEVSSRAQLWITQAVQEP